MEHKDLEALVLGMIRKTPALCPHEYVFDQFIKNDDGLFEQYKCKICGHTVFFRVQSVNNEDSAK